MAKKDKPVDLTSPENHLLLALKDGTVKIQLRPDKAPRHVKRIKALAREGFYDGIIFHRVIEGFMAQTGDPKGTGTGGSGQNLKAEFNDLPHNRGTCSMARAMNVDSADSQFFICFKSADFLNRQYTVSRWSIYHLGSGGGRHGVRRRHRARRTARQPRQNHQPQSRGGCCGERCLSNRPFHVVIPGFTGMTSFWAVLKPSYESFAVRFLPAARAYRPLSGGAARRGAAAACDARAATRPHRARIAGVA